MTGEGFKTFGEILKQIEGFVWGVPLIVLIILTGIYLTIRVRGLQVRHLGKALKFMVKNEEGGEGEVTSFGALCTALSATIGTGNIVGVATALAAGGPGALFWMIVAAFFGMATKYTEGFLAIKYRTIDEEGHVLGGPFYYIENGMGKKWKCAIVLGFLCFKLFNRMNSVFPHTRRLPILGLALCFGLSYISEKYFGIADITGAYVAGVILCSLDSSDYIEEKMDISSYMIFGPIFFASIGLKTTLSGMNEKFVLFAICFVIVGLVAKIIGCGLMSKGCGFTWGDSLKIGVGMMTRGEVCLIVAQKGLNAGFLSGDFFSAVILLILFSSVATPIILKILYAKMPTAKDSAKAS